MADESTQSITIHAAPADVLAVIAAFDEYPQWAGSVKSVHVTAPGTTPGRPDQVAFKIDAGVIRDEYELAYVWNGDAGVSWSLVKSQIQKAQRGEYRLRADGADTEVTYTLSVDMAMPMLGMLKRKAEKMIMDTALKELKKRVESV